MPEVGRDDREYWLKMLLGLGVEAHRLAEQLLDEQKLYDPDGEAREAKKRVYAFECDCTARATQFIESTPLKFRQRKVMKLRYIKKLPWKVIFCILDTSGRYTYRLHDKALRGVSRQHSGVDFKALYAAEHEKLENLNPYRVEE